MEKVDSSLLLQALIAGLAIVAFYTYFNSAYSYWKKRGVKTIKPLAPFGNFAKSLFLSNPGFQVAEFYHELESEKFRGLYSFNRPSLLLRDHELIKDVMVKDFGRFYSRRIQSNDEIKPLEDNLFSLSGPEWRNLRVKRMPIFTSGKLKKMFPTMVETGKQLQEYPKTPAGKKEVIEIKDILI